MDKILTVRDVAALLQVKEITVREMFRERRLRGFKMGKSWRTTETMLEEDIAALARGEQPLSGEPMPPAAPAVAAPAPGPARKKRVAQSAATGGPKAAPVAPADTTPEGTAPAPEAAPEEEVSTAKRRRKAADETDDDTQQLLF